MSENDYTAKFHAIFPQKELILINLFICNKCLLGIFIRIRTEFQLTS